MTMCTKYIRKRNLIKKHIAKPVVNKILHIGRKKILVVMIVQIQYIVI